MISLGAGHSPPNTILKNSWAAGRGCSGKPSGKSAAPPALSPGLRGPMPGSRGSGAQGFWAGVGMYPAGRGPGCTRGLPFPHPLSCCHLGGCPLTPEEVLVGSSHHANPQTHTKPGSPWQEGCGGVGLGPWWLGEGPQRGHSLAPALSPQCPAGRSSLPFPEWLWVNPGEALSCILPLPLLAELCSPSLKQDPHSL